MFNQACREKYSDDDREIEHMTTQRNIKMMSHIEVKKLEPSEDHSKRLWIEDNPQNKVRRKEWGSELVILREPYACKVMTLEPGTTCSTHFHADKQETFVLVSGELLIELTNLNTGTQETVALTKPFSSITLYPFVPHRFYTPNSQIGPTVFVEASTVDKDHDNYKFTESSSKAINNR